MQEADKHTGAAAEDEKNNALIACKVPDEVFTDPHVKDQFEKLFRQFDVGVSFQFFRSFHRVRVNFSTPAAAAQARLKLHKSDFTGKEMRLYFAQAHKSYVKVSQFKNWTVANNAEDINVAKGSPRLEPPKPEKQFLISPPASPPVGWEQSQDATPIVNYDLLCAVSKLGPGEQYELHTGTTTTPSVIVHVCEDDSSDGEQEAEGGTKDRRKIIQTRRPDYVQSVKK